MTADKDALLRDVLDTLMSCTYKPGDSKGFEHINYCQWCHYAESHPHGDTCPIYRITAALAERDDGKSVYQQMAEGGYTIAVFKDGKLLAADADVYQAPLPKGDKQ